VLSLIETYFLFFGGLCPMARNYVDSASFVKCFLAVHKEGGDIQAVADRLGMQKASATVKASQLRQAGIQLPKLSQSRKKLDLGALAKMVSDYEANLSVDSDTDLDGHKNVTISDHLDEDVPDDLDDGDLDEDVQDEDDEVEEGVSDEDIPGRGLVNAHF
jgi:hypothetical protein